MASILVTIEGFPFLVSSYMLSEGYKWYSSHLVVLNRPPGDEVLLELVLVDSYTQWTDADIGESQ